MAETATGSVELKPSLFKGEGADGIDVLNPILSTTAHTRLMSPTATLSRYSANNNSTVK